jgi:hypothetical protein
LIQLVKQALSLVVSADRATIIVAALLFGLPDIISATISASSALSTAETIRALFTAKATEQSNFTDFLLPLEPDIWLNLSLFLVSYLCSLWALYLVIIATHEAGHGHQSRLGSNLVQGLRLMARTALPVSFFGLIFLFLGNVFDAFGLVIMILAMMAPVLITTENRGTLSSIGRSLSLRYARESEASGWPTAVALITAGSLFYAVVLLARAGANSLFDIDLWFPDLMPAEQWTWFKFGFERLLELSLSTAAILGLIPFYLAVYQTVTHKQIREMV